MGKEVEHAKAVALRKAEEKRKQEEEEERRRQQRMAGPSAALARYGEGKAAYERGDLETAVERLKEATSAESIWPEGKRTEEMGALALLGKVCMKLKKFTDAIA